MNHTRLESMFLKKQVPSLHAHPPWHTHAHHDTIFTLCIVMCTRVHIVVEKAILLDFVMIVYMMKI